MNREWMEQRLEQFIAACQEVKTGWVVRDFDSLEAEHAVMYGLEPTVKTILIHLDPDLGTFDTAEGEVEHAIRDSQRGLGVLRDLDEIQQMLASDSPALRADRLHPWVWDAAQTFWDAGAFGVAVEQAAKSITAHTQAKSAVHDLADDALMQEVLTENEAKPGGRVRLRLPGDRSTPTWHSRQRGMQRFALGVFYGIRNPAAHDHRPDWPEQVALEYLAALSVLARWISETEVEAPPGI
jgi:hypothetical protein